MQPIRRQDVSKGKKDEPLSGSDRAALQQVAELAAIHGLKPWELAGMLRAESWTDDKSVTKAEFDAAVTRLRERRVGGGR
jgi:predicted dinucleotide-binding enzyme